MSNFFFFFIQFELFIVQQFGPLFLLVTITKKKKKLNTYFHFCCCCILFTFRRRFLDKIFPRQLRQFGGPRVCFLHFKFQGMYLIPKKVPVRGAVLSKKWGILEVKLSTLNISQINNRWTTDQRCRTVTCTNSRLCQQDNFFFSGFQTAAETQTTLGQSVFC